MISRWLLLVVGLLLAWSTQPATAKGDKPKVSSEKLDHPPYDLFYFKGSETILYRDPNTRTGHVSHDGGKKWDAIKGPDGSMEHAVLEIWPHPHDPKRAYVLGEKGQHWITTDGAESWRSFEIPALPNMDPGNVPLAFNGWDSKKVIFIGKDCSSIIGCAPKAWYTTDDFKTWNPLQEWFYSCMWAAGTPEFARDIDVSESIGDRVLCVVPGQIGSGHSERLIYSDNFFRDGVDGTDVNLDRGRPVAGRQIIARSVKKYLVVGLQSQKTTEQALYISDDSKEWHRAEFRGHRIEEDAYTVLESTNYSIQVDVQTSWHKNSMGVLFSSNSNGTYFTPNIEHTNRRNGFVDFEKVADIQGIVIVNTVKNWEEVEGSEDAEKKLVSAISFDDGRTFQPLKADDKKLHIHSMTTYNALREYPTGRMFSSPAPGIVMGVGNTGDNLKDYYDGDLYVSDDAGLTWRRALEGPHHFAFGDQGGIIVAIKDDKEDTNKVHYSLNHGQEWEDPIKLEHKIRPVYITTTPEATSLKFLLVGISEKKEIMMYSIDFEGLHERKCSKDDLEPWWARLDEDGKPDCLMGHKQKYTRRKANAECFIKEDKLEPPTFDRCECSAEDFECDYNFKRSEDGKDCVPAVPLTPPAGKCKNSDDKYVGPSGWRLIPGNACIRKDGKNLDDEIERTCGNSTGSPVSDGKVRVGKTQSFAGKRPDYYYLDRQTSNSGDDETVFLITEKGEVFISRDHGNVWEQPKALKDEKFVAIIPHTYYSDAAYFLTAKDTAYSTINRGETFNKLKVPTSILDRGKYDPPPMAFHEKEMDWIIWIGKDKCKSDDCLPSAYLSRNRGASWEGPDLRGVGQCSFAYHSPDRDDKNLVICEQYEKESKNNNLQLVSTELENGWFADRKVINPSIAHFVTMNKYVIVATKFVSEKRQDFLNLSTSLDGRVWAEAHLPVNVDVPSYTALPGSDHALFMFVQTGSEKGRRFGSLVKSNSNGTYFVSSLGALNEDDSGYTDYEKMAHLEGVIIANIVANVDDVKDKGTAKKLRTAITHNDGGQWAYLPPPSRDVDDKKFDCSVTEGKGTEACALHLHAYTERVDWRDTFYSGSAVGMIIGVGNVGEYLGSGEDADTFFSNDGGITWTNVKKGRYMYEFGDAGSVIVLVREFEKTNEIFYSLDEGRKWEPFKFTEDPVFVLDISTVPSDTSKRFLLWAKSKASDDEYFTIPLDFSGLWDRVCTPPDGEEPSDDYYLWTPKHPLQEDNCLFGHVEQYHRKKPGMECWVDWREPHVHRVEGSNCTCSRADYECDFNYEIQSDGSCQLVPGLQKPDHSLQCQDDPEQVEYWEPTGYRRLPQTTCQGGLALDKLKPLPCPNKEKEFEKKHGISGVGLFFAIVTPIAAAVGIGYFVYTRWDGKFGQIRLGESSGSSESWFARDSILVAIPVAIIAGIVAVAQSLPLLASSLWRSVSGLVRGRSRGYQRPYATRGSFAARRGDYTHVVDDEDELLGADDLDDDEE